MRDKTYAGNQVVAFVGIWNLSKRARFKSALIILNKLFQLLLAAQVATENRNFNTGIIEWYDKLTMATTDIKRSFRNEL